MTKKKYKYVILGFITIAVFSIINISLIKFNLLYQSNKNRVITYKTENDIEKTETSMEKNQVINSQKEINLENVKSINSNWKILIPRIEIDAPISDGTEPGVLLNFVGHFNNTSKFDGNIGLAAHNTTFFKNLKNIKLGDEIIYIYEFGKKQYRVNYIEKIQETDWTKLGNTQENKITLITCVQNMPQLRLCVQAIEI